MAVVKFVRVSISIVVAPYKLLIRRCFIVIVCTQFSICPLYRSGLQDVNR